MFRFFARKMPTQPKDWPVASTPLSEEFEKFLKTMEGPSSPEDDLKSKISSNNSLDKIAKAISMGKEIDLDHLDLNFSDNIEKSLKDSKIQDPILEPGTTRVQNLQGKTKPQLNKQNKK